MTASSVHAAQNKKQARIISVLRATSPTCVFEHVNFVVSNRGSIVPIDFYTALNTLDVQEGKKNRVFTDNVTHCLMLLSLLRKK